MGEKITPHLHINDSKFIETSHADVVWYKKVTFSRFS